MHNDWKLVFTTAKCPSCHIPSAATAKIAPPLLASRHPHVARNLRSSGTTGR